MSGEGSESVCSSGDEDQGIEREESERGSGKESSDDNDDSAGPSGGAGRSFIDVRAIESTSGVAREVRIFE